MAVRILVGDVRAMLRTPPDESVHCGATTAEACVQNGCHYLDCGNGEPAALTAQNAAHITDSTHSIIDAVANLIEDHECIAEAKSLRRCKKNIPNVPFTG